jgi:hypothetical protein
MLEIVYFIYLFVVFAKNLLYYRCMNFERGTDIKEILDIGLVARAREIVSVRFILLTSGMEIKWTPLGNNVGNNVETCISLKQEHVFTILEQMEKGDFVNTQLLEITEKMPPVVGPNGDQDYLKCHLGKDMMGEVLKYKGKFYIIKK